jgi:rubredoxin
MAKFNVYDGIFVCQKCGSETNKIRLWKDTLDLTWQCQSCKYVSKVVLDIKGY